jgi:uncharacterized DUF497 family protein
MSANTVSISFEPAALVFENESCLVGPDCIDEAGEQRWHAIEAMPVAALCHMVRGVQSDDASESSHEQKYHNRTKPETSRLSPVSLQGEGGPRVSR